MTGNTQARAILLAVLMVTSVFAFAGVGSADISSSDRDIADQSPAPGADVTVTVTATVDNGSNAFTLAETFDPTFQDALVESVQVDGSDITGSAQTFSDGTGANVIVSADQLTDGSTVTVEYTVTALDRENATHNITGEVTNGNAQSVGGDTEFTTTSDSSTPTPTPTPTPVDPGDERLVQPGDTLFQGEDDFVISDGAGTRLTVGDFERTSGDNEGVPLQEPIPQDQATGSYNSEPDGTGTSVTVQTARVSSFDINNENGADVSDGTISSSNDIARVVAEYNFETSEALEVVVEDESGLDVTGAALAGADAEDDRDGDGTARFEIDLNELESGEEYTVTVLGADDLDFGAAEQSATLEISAQDDATLELDQDTATQGENVQFDIEGADEEDIHPVLIDGGDVRDGRDVGDVFRDVGDTVDTGEVDGDAVALIEIDGGTGVGQVETGVLDDTGIDVTLFDSVDRFDDDSSVSDVESDDLDTPLEADEQTLEVTEGTITLDNPTGTYVIGSEITINGTTAPGIEDVAIYARDEGDYTLVTTINVDGDDTFEQEDFDLVGDSENPNALNIPGTYRIATVDANSDELDDDDELGPDEFVTTSEVSAAVGSQTSLRAVDQSLTLDTVSVTNGQVAVGDEITVEGVAPGQNEVSVSFYGPRGTYDRTEISVDENGEFSDDNIQVGNNDLGQPISQGTVVMTVFSNGRDGVTGDGELNGVEAGPDGDNDPDYQEAFANFYENLNDTPLTQQQVLDRVSSESTEDTGSDDISQAVRFRLIDAQTSINTVTSANATDNVVVAGDTMTVSGVTNRQAEDTDITVEVIEGPTRTEFELNSTDQWGTDGRWSVTLDTTGVEPGNYTVEASDGTSSDVFDFQVVEQQPEPEPEPTASVTFNDQALSSDGTVTVASVTMSEGGFVTIHDDTVGEDPVGSVVGTSDFLEPGTTRNVEVGVETTPGQHFAMPHRDTNGNEAYDFVSSNGAEDAPYTTAAGDIVLAGAQISAPSTPTPTPTEAPTPTPTAEPDTPTDTPEPEEPTPTETTSGGQPGFGLVVSVLALLGAALLALRRRD